MLILPIVVLILLFGGGGGYYYGRGAGWRTASEGSRDRAETHGVHRRVHVAHLVFVDVEAMRIRTLLGERCGSSW
jgi:hypothetical protein